MNFKWWAGDNKICSEGNMELYLVIILLSCARAGGLEAQAAPGSDQFDVIGDQDALHWNNLEDLAELEKNAEYSIKVIILTMNRW